MHLRLSRRCANCIGLFLLLAGIRSIQAGSAIWTINPPTTSWNSATNWMPATVPNSPNDTATFGSTNQGLPVIHSNIELDTLLFSADAPAPITVTVGDPLGASVTSLTLSGMGMVDDSDYQFFFEETAQSAPTLVSKGARNVIYFKNAAAISGNKNTGISVVAGGGNGADFAGGQVQFLDNSTAGTASPPTLLVALAGENGGGAGELYFLDQSSVGNSYLASYTGSVAGSTPGVTYFMGTSTAANAYVSCLSTQAANVEGGKVFFLESSTAGDASCLVEGERTEIMPAEARSPSRMRQARVTQHLISWADWTGDLLARSTSFQIQLVELQRWN